MNCMLNSRCCSKARLLLQKIEGQLGTRAQGLRMKEAGLFNATTCQQKPNRRASSFVIFGRVGSPRTVRIAEFYSTAATLVLVEPPNV